MSVNNPCYGQVEGNSICLDVGWKKEGGEALEKWRNGMTGYPFIDAVMRQLRQVHAILHMWKCEYERKMNGQNEKK